MFGVSELVFLSLLIGFCYYSLFKFLIKEQLTTADTML